MNAHADMFIVVSTQRIKHTKGHLLHSYFGLVKVSSFQEAKTSANKRFLICLQTILFGLRCKGTIKFADVQILSRKSFSVSTR